MQDFLKLIVLLAITLAGCWIVTDYFETRRTAMQAWKWNLESAHKFGDHEARIKELERERKDK